MIVLYFTCPNVLFRSGSWPRLVAGPDGQSIALDTVRQLPSDLYCEDGRVRLGPALPHTGVGLDCIHRYTAQSSSPQACAIIWGSTQSLFDIISCHLPPRFPIRQFSSLWPRIYPSCFLLLPPLLWSLIVLCHRIPSFKISFLYNPTISMSLSTVSINRVYGPPLPLLPGRYIYNRVHVVVF